MVGQAKLVRSSPGATELLVNAEDNITVDYWDANPDSAHRVDTAGVKTPPPIFKVWHDAYGELAASDDYNTTDVLTVWMNGTKNMYASFTLGTLSTAQNMTMHDDGAHDDGAAGDGIYCGEYHVKPQDTGTWTVWGYLSNGFVDASSKQAFPNITINCSRPVAPKNITCTPMPQGNALNVSWAPRANPDTAMFKVYRSNQSQFNSTKKNYTYVGYTLGHIPWLIDTGLVDNDTYYYSIKAITAPFSNESWWSREGLGVPEDILGPWTKILTPVNDTTMGLNASITLSGDSDILGCKVQYYKDLNNNGIDDDGGSWVEVAGYGTVFTGIYWYTDTAHGGPGEGSYVMMRAQGFDEVLNWGTWSTPVINITIDNTPPTKPTLDDNLPTITRNATQKLTGTSEAFGSVDALVNGTFVGTKAVGSDGKVDMSILLPLRGYNNITLVGFDRYKNGPSIPSDMRTVIFDDLPPIAVPGNNRTAKANEIVMLNGSGSYDICPVPAYASIVSYTWTILDNAQSINKSGAIVSHIFQQSGSHKVTLKVTDLAGNSGARDIFVFMGDDIKPLVNAGPDIYTDEDKMIFFNASLCSDNDPNFFQTAIFNWSFKDGSNRSVYGLMTPYTFTEPGEYAVTLNVSDYSGNWAMDALTVHVKDLTPPVANAGPDASVIKARPLTFDGSKTKDNSKDILTVGNFTWSFEYENGEVVLFGIYPSYIFMKAGTYNVTLNVTDLGGNWDPDNVIITVLNDAVLPYVKSTYPLDGSLDVPVTTDITVIFSESILPSTLSTTTIMVENKDNNLVPGKFSYNDSALKMTFKPNAQFEREQVYTMTLTVGVKDIAGNGLKANYVFSFQTVTPPYIVSVYPENGATNVSRFARINATFSEELENAIIKDLNITVILFSNASGPVNGSYYYDHDLNNLTFNPLGTELFLEYNTTYYVVITTNITDKNNIPMESQYTWEFKTEWTPFKPPKPVVNNTNTTDDDVVKDDDDEGIFGLSWFTFLAIVIIIAIIFIIILIGVASYVSQKRKREEEERRRERQRQAEEQAERDNQLREEQRQRQMDESRRRRARSSAPRGLTPKMTNELLRRAKEGRAVKSKPPPPKDFSEGKDVNLNAVFEEDTNDQEPEWEEPEEQTEPPEEEDDGLNWEEDEELAQTEPVEDELEDLEKPKKDKKDDDDISFDEEDDDGLKWE